MANTNYYEAGRSDAFQKIGLFTQAALGAMKAKEMNPKDPEYGAGAITGVLGGVGGSAIAGPAGMLAGALAGGAVGIPLSVILKKPELLRKAVDAGAMVGGVGGAIGGSIYGARALPEALLKDTRKPKK